MPAPAVLALSAAVPSPAFGDPQPDIGTGVERTYLMGVRAEAHVDAELRPSFTPEPGTPFTQNFFYVDLDPYTVLQGKPQGRPEYHCRMYSRVGLGDYEYSDQPPAPQDVATGATMRWLPTDLTWIAQDRWDAFVGGEFTFSMDPDTAPYLDEGYSWAVRGGDEVEGQAIVFDGDSWLKASDRGWSASGFTLAMVAVFHANTEGGRTYGVFASMQEDMGEASDVGDVDVVDPDSPPPAVDWGIRYRQGTLQVYAGSIVVSHEVAFPLGRPVLLAVSMDNQEGKLLVADRTKSTRSFSTAGMNVFDQQLVVGRQRGRTDTSATANMDVLEIDWFDHALAWDELSELLHQVDSAYGVMG